jgi:transcriptional regulator with XRE-family HTH domain
MPPRRGTVTNINAQDDLADRLRDMRTRAGLSGKELAAAADWHASKVSRIELGRQTPTQADVDVWAGHCGADSATTQEALQLLASIQAEHRGWRRRMRRGQTVVQSDYNRLVADATVVRHFETVYVPGLLQTPDYARSVLAESADLHSPGIDDVEAAVTARLQRQQMLYDGSKRFEFLLAEPVLRWLICPPQVMRGQLDRLQTALGLPNVRFGILPMGVQLHTTPQNSFQAYDDVVTVETFVGESVHHGDDASAYLRALDRMWEQAATGQDARQLILRAVEAL